MVKGASWLAGSTGAILMLSTLTASAGFIDFTDAAAYGVRSAGMSAGSAGFADWTVSDSDDSLTYTSFDGNDSDLGPLKGDYDGIGLGDNEISFGQTLTVSFDRPVLVSGFYFLDLFTARDAGSKEIARIYLGTDTSGTPLSVYDAPDSQIVGNDSGFRFGSLRSPVSATDLTFTVSVENDKAGIADYALAGIVEITPAPLPAGAILLGSGLLAFGSFMRRRKA